MDINTLTRTLAVALADDTALTSWAQATYSRGHQVYRNIDTGNPPGADEAPFLLLYPQAKSVSARRDRKPHVYHLEAVIYDEEPVSPATRANLTEYYGLIRLEEFRKLAENCLKTALDALAEDIVIVEINIDYDPIESFPFFLVGMEIHLEEDVCIGGDYFD